MMNDELPGDVDKSYEDRPPYFCPIGDFHSQRNENSIDWLNKATGVHSLDEAFY